MDYIKKNKQAWEDAYDKKTDAFEKDMVEHLWHVKDAYLTEHMIKTLDQLDLKGKTIGQFCTNNGRELLSISRRGVKRAIGFDIASNMVLNANQMAKTLGYPVTFVETNILDVDQTYHDLFDVVIITVGALCWFRDLNALFKIVGACLKADGVIIIEETHPLINMLATKDEHNFNENHPKDNVNDYFKLEPWTDIEGMGYMTNEKTKNTFVSFSHTLSDMINAMIINKIQIEHIEEYDQCIANLFDHLNQQGIPLSILIQGRKMT
ncbi:MAG: class I SAM-dependent methyltransferase [Acholeplasmataceae bacterium]